MTANDVTPFQRLRRERSASTMPAGPLYHDAFFVQLNSDKSQLSVKSFCAITKINTAKERSSTAIDQREKKIQKKNIEEMGGQMREIYLTFDRERMCYYCGRSESNSVALPHKSGHFYSCPLGPLACLICFSVLSVSSTKCCMFGKSHPFQDAGSV